MAAGIAYSKDFALKPLFDFYLQKLIGNKRDKLIPINAALIILFRLQRVDSIAAWKHAGHLILKAAPPTR